MVTISTPEDLLRALRENPEWKEAVRREILTEQLLNLPARFDQFAASTEGFIEEQRQFNAETGGRVDRLESDVGQLKEDVGELKQDVGQLKEDVEQLKEDVGELKQDVGQLKEDVGELKQDVGQLKNDVRTIRDDLGNLKGFRARDETIQQADGVAIVMGFQMVRTLSYGDLVSMTTTADISGIAEGDILSFRRADLVIEATDANGETRYIAMEISYTADARDTRRAIRNASLLSRFTGRPAHAAIASVQNVNEIQDTIDSGQVYWHKLIDRDAAPE